MAGTSQVLQIVCKNNQKTEKVTLGTSLSQIYIDLQVGLPHPPMCATVNNWLVGLDTPVYRSAVVEFFDFTSAMGRKVYMRSLTMVLFKAVEDLLPGSRLNVEAPVSKGYFFTIDPAAGLLPEGVTLETAQQLRQRMRDIIAEGHRFHHEEGPTSEVAKLFRSRGMERKAKLIEGRGKLFSRYYRLADTYDYYYAPLVPSTDYLESFDLVKYYEGLLLRLPREDGQLPEIVKQDKMLQAFRDDHKLEQLIGLTSVGELNEAVRSGHASDAIKVAEALQEKKIAKIADQIAERGDVKVVLLAGPSSSGKTTTSKRLSVQLMANGLRPVALSLDDYFVDREKTPLDESGDYDYEHINALNLPLFRQQLNQLLAGEEVELPRYDFPTGQSVRSGKHMRLGERDILILEGIHALNPLMSEGVDDSRKFRLYVSALTSIKLDDHNYIPTTDNRLIRRLVRDHNFRGTSAQSTIARWPSVRRGEDRWIFPYQENADAMFNSAMIYELAVLRNYALPLLLAVHEDEPEHAQAMSLAGFLTHFLPIDDKELPPTSLLREFLGGSSFQY